MDDFARQIIAVLLLSLRIMPALAFAPPFTLMRVPVLVRLALGVALGLWLVNLFPGQTWQRALPDNYLVAIAAELFLGVTFAVTLQVAFAALLTAGRTIDIQAGFGLSMLIDPATRSQVPLAGTLLSYAAAAIFFLTSGPADLFALLADSVRHVPLGADTLDGKLELLLDYVGSVFLLAFGSAGLIILTLFIVDLAIAFMSRTLPQMNVLVLGFQVKTLVVLAVLPVVIGLSAALLMRLIRTALETMAGMA